MVVGTLGIAQTLIILTAGIDLSVGAIMVLSSIVMAKLSADAGVPGLLALLLGLRRRHRLRLHQRRADHPPQAPAVHRHARHAERLLRDQPLVSPRARRSAAPTCPSLLLWTGNTFNFGDTRITYGIDPDAGAVRGLRVGAQEHRVGQARLRGRRRRRGRAPGRRAQGPRAAQRLHRRRPDLRRRGLDADRPHRLRLAAGGRVAPTSTRSPPS